MRPRTYAYISGLLCHECGEGLPPVPENKLRSGRGRFCSKQCLYKSNSKNQRLPVEPRFWGNVKKTDFCWEWVGCKRNNYGCMSAGGVQKDAHRLSWELHFGKIPDGMFVCHRCDNPACVRPAHLFLGTIQDNHADMVRKGRGIKGTKCHLAKLTDAKVVEIRALAKTTTMTHLVEMTGLSMTTISNVVNNKSWKHVTPLTQKGIGDPICAVMARRLTCFSLLEDD